MRYFKLLLRKSLIFGRENEKTREQQMSEKQNNTTVLQFNLHETCGSLGVVKTNHAVWRTECSMFNSSEHIKASQYKRKRYHFLCVVKQQCNSSQLSRSSPTGSLDGVHSRRVAPKAARRSQSLRVSSSAVTPLWDWTGSTFNPLLGRSA